jgi:hypothetical protein
LRSGALERKPCFFCAGLREPVVIGFIPRFVGVSNYRYSLGLKLGQCCRDTLDHSGVLIFDARLIEVEEDQTETL